MYQYTLGGSEKITSKDLVEKLNAAKRSFRSGIGYRSTLLITHPSNLEKVRAIVKVLAEDSCPYLFRPFPFRVVPSIHVPSCVIKDTGNILWKKTRFCDYSKPSSNMPYDEYLDMCLYFKWAVKETIKCAVWYELDSASFEEHINLALELKRFGPTTNGNLEKLLKIYDKEMPVISDKRQALINGLF